MNDAGTGRLGHVGQRVFLWAALAFIAIKLALLVAYALRCEYIMDEYAQVGGGWLELPRFYRDVDPIKTVLHYYYYRLAWLVADDAVGILRAARLLTVPLAVGMAGLTYAASRALGRPRGESLLCVAALLAFSNFLERSIEVRADTVAAFLSTAALLTVVRGRQPRRAALLAGLLVGAAFLCTQKSVYVLLALGCGLAAADEPGSGWRPRVARLTCFGGAWSAALVLYAAWLGQSELVQVLAMIFTSPSEVALHAADYYPRIRHYVTQTLARNLVPYALAVTGLCLGLWRAPRQQPGTRLALVASAVLSILIFSHDQPWPYVFVVLLPCLSLWAVEPLRELNSGCRHPHPLLLLTALVLFATSLPRNVRYLEHDNGVQNRIASQAEALLRPGEPYCDGVWMIVTRPSACSWWDAIATAKFREAAAGGDSQLVDAIFRGEPKLWIWNYRVEALLPLLEERLAASYVPVAANLLLAGAELRPNVGFAFRVPWSGRYALYDNEGRPTQAELVVDGTRVRGPVDLDAAARTVRLESKADEGVFLLPEDFRLPARLGSRPPAFDLFAGVYEK